MKKETFFTLVIILLIVSISIYYTFLKIPFNKAIKLGLDLQSGTHLVLQLQPVRDVKEITPEDVDRTIAVIERRINKFGTLEPIIQKYGNDRIIVDIPSETNPQKAIEIVTKTAYLEFKERHFNPKKGEYEWRTVMTGADLKTATSEFDPQGKPVVAFTLTKEGAKKFREITERNLHKPVAIFLDGKLISQPTVQSVIYNGAGIITGSKDIKEAETLAKFLQAGALPFPVKVIESVTVGPILGKTALIKSLWAGILGLLLVSIFMIWFYRFPGFMADLALIVYGLVLLFFFSITDSTLTLPGIAGFILSIGMAVDANILQFERLKEELKEGKSLKEAIDIGFSRAFSSILDSHATTAIAALVLYYYGASTIKGFGFTLFFGTLFSFFTAIWVTRAFINLFLQTSIITNKKWYGA